MDHGATLKDRRHSGGHSSVTVNGRERSARLCRRLQTLKTEKGGEPTGKGAFFGIGCGASLADHFWQVIAGAVGSLVGA